MHGVLCQTAEFSCCNMQRLLPGLGMLAAGCSGSFRDWECLPQVAATGPGYGNACYSLQRLFIALYPAASNFMYDGA